MKLLELMMNNLSNSLYYVFAFSIAFVIKKKTIEDTEQISYGTKYGIQTPDIMGIKRKIILKKK